MYNGFILTLVPEHFFYIAFCDIIVIIFYDENIIVNHPSYAVRIIGVYFDILQ